MPRIDTIVVHAGPQGPTGAAGTNIYVQPGDPGSVPDGTLWLDTDDTTPDTSLNWGDIAGTLSNQTDLQTALNAKTTLPTQTGNAGKYLQTDGTNPSWQPAATSPLTTKGDIYGRGASADARVPVGANGTVPVADSTQATGIGYAYRTLLPPRIGSWLVPETHGPGTTNLSATQTAAANQMDCCAIYIPEPITVNDIRINITVASTSGNARLGIYSWAGTLILDAGAVSTAATGNAFLTINQTLPVGWCVPVLLADAACTYRAYTPVFTMGVADVGTTTASGGWQRIAQTYGALPSSITVSFGNLGNGPRIGLKRSA